MPNYRIQNVIYNIIDGKTNAKMEFTCSSLGFWTIRRILWAAREKRAVHSNVSEYKATRQNNDGSRFVSEPTLDQIQFKQSQPLSDMRKNPGLHTAMPHSDMYEHLRRTGANEDVYMACTL